jgi:flavin reductase (DIM6/NTAB) family NADH-FMN oxidoreductase RutF
MKIELPIELATMKVFPLPVSLVTCKDKNGKVNVLTVTYLNGVNEKPPMIGIAVGVKKHSFSILRDTKEFAVNIPTKDLLSKVDYCGSFSGRDVDKVKECNFRMEGLFIQECSINLKCKKVKEFVLGSHCFFIGEIISFKIDMEFIKGNLPDFNKFHPIITTFTDYREIGQKIGEAFKEH